MSSRRKRRVPQCARCRSHDTIASVRGHKRECQWKDCTCAKCLMVTEKRRVTAVRVALLRSERKRRMSHTIDPFHIGLHGARPWGMMGQVPYSIKEYHDNRRMIASNEPYCSEMLQMKYRGMYPHYENTYHHVYPREGLPCRDDEPNKTDSGITQNLESFQHEYESFMRKLNDGKLSPGNNTEMTQSRSSSPSHQICIRPTNPHNQMNICRPSPAHGNIYRPMLSHPNHRYLPMIVNTPLTACPCPKSSEFPYGVCM